MGHVGFDRAHVGFKRSHVAWGGIIPPTLISITPAFGSHLGGDAVTIVGTGFQAGATVKINANSATSVVVVDDAHITCVTPAHAVGVVTVQVTNPDGGSATGLDFTYIDTYTYTFAYKTWYGRGNTYPTIIQNIPGAAGANAGKGYNGGAYHFTRFRFLSHESPAASKITANTIYGATLNLNVSVNDQSLESFGYFKVYLAANGADWYTTGAYDPAGLPLLASVAAASVPASGAFPIPLDLSVLNAHHGEDLVVLCTTSVEEVGGPVDPWPPGGPSSYVGVTGSAPTCVLQF